MQGLRRPRPYSRSGTTSLGSYTWVFVPERLLALKRRQPAQRVAFPPKHDSYSRAPAAGAAPRAWRNR
jgi:hypothetical protein